MGKEQEVIEGNKLIAEFMGYTYYPDDSINGIKGALRKDGVIGVIGLILNPNEDNKQFGPHYHSSWDWLMPVVEKIHERYSVSLSGISSITYRFMERQVIANLKGCSTMDIEPLSESVNGISISSTYKLVVQFITWFNQQHKD